MPATKQATVIDILSRRKVQPVVETADAKTISQQRLAEGLQLLREEHRIAQALREFAVAVELEMRSGAVIEAGELTFDRNLKVARRNTTTSSGSAAAQV